MSETVKVMNVQETHAAIESLKHMGYRVLFAQDESDEQRVRMEHDELLDTLEFVREMLMLAVRADSYLSGPNGIVIRMAIKRLREQAESIEVIAELPF